MLLADAAWLLPPLVAGLVLRCWNLRDQVLGGDELHGVRAAVENRPADILRHFSTADHSLPLSATLSALLRSGVELDESSFRAPSLLAGALLVLVLPLLAARALGRPTAVVWSWLLALSPALVLYSRIARSYLPMVLAVCLALAAFAAWWERRTPARAAAFVPAAALAVWLHLGAAPIVASPFLFALLDLLVTRQRGARRALRDLALLAAALAAAMATFLVPALPSVIALVSEKRQGVDVSLRAMAEVVRLHAGTANGALAGAVALLAAGGLVVLARVRPRLAALLATAAAAQVAGILWLAPEGVGFPIVLGRYLLPALPIALLGVACALAPPRRPSGDEGAPAGEPARRGVIAARLGVAALLLLALWWTGPLRAPAFLRGSFAHHNAFVAFAGEPLAPALGDAGGPEAPLALYAALPPGPVVELPWPTAWNLGRSFPAYQLRHGRRVLVSAAEGLPAHPRLRLRNAVPLRPDALLASPAAAAVVHRCLPCEEQRMRGGLAHRLRIPGAARGRMVEQGERAAAELERAWGPPHFGSGAVVAWDLARLRRERAAARAAASPP